jgi:hypothetical protein
VPLPIPPRDGLQLQTPRLSYDGVTRVVRAPVLAAAAEASHPACPPPITTTSTGGLHGMLAIVLRSQVHVGMFLTWHRCGLRQWPAHAGRLPQTALEARGPRVCVLLLRRRALCVAVWPAQRSSKVHEGESWESLERDSGSGCGEEMETGDSLASCNNTNDSMFPSAMVYEYPCQCNGELNIPRLRTCSHRHSLNTAIDPTHINSRTASTPNSTCAQNDVIS